MGGCFSCKSSTKFNNIRVVHFNGYVQEFENPVSVRQVTAGQLPSKNLVFTAAQLLSTESKPLKADVQLETGQLYFMLPYSILQPDVSPVDFLALVKKLSSKAESSRRGQARSSGTSSLSGQRNPICRAQARKPWKPVLDTIREKSFNRRSESELQDMDSETSRRSLMSDVFL
ncbi:hypothetical protein OIU77_005560 [Salix suchowensis]|uniref:Uncharacterized protein n=1 Tax=Salix suchowensis TaxID=1278906 RepID=A0ABQ9AR70_9ROSI|nr:hypothetical protein OIU77_005560 [Salix suchowensis]